MNLLPLLSVQQLNVRFNTEEGSFHALEDISFDVDRGGITAIVGESGSGKSVTALSVLKLLSVPPAEYSSGKILFSEDGKEANDVLTMSEDQIRKLRGNRISMIFQEPMTSLNPLITCGDQVAEAIMLHRKIPKKQASEIALELFRQVQLPDPAGMLNRYPHQISGGQKQRVMIAMAMSCEPSLLIADEPTTALDVTVQKNILALIKDLQRSKNMGVIFITHDLGLVSEIADRVIVMYRGRIVEQGDREQVLNSPKHPYTKALLACRPILHQPGERLPLVSDYFEGRDTERNAETQKSTTSAIKATSSEPLIEVKELKVWFPATRSLLGKPKVFTKAVDGVSFSIFKGETLGLVGESGCGKTTLGRALLRLVDSTEGSINYNGRELTHMTRKELKPFRKEIQIIFQDPYSSLNPRIPIGTAIREVMEVHGIWGNERGRTEHTVALLEKVGLTADHFSRYPHEFSGGQRQRIGIARALALNPGFLVCDESVSALDVSVQAQVLNLLNDLKKEYGFTVLFISHDLSVVHYISDRIIVMNQGRIEEIGPAGEVFHRPGTDYTRKLIAAIPGRKMEDTEDGMEDRG
ncbi:MAG TPA: ABC transporter ATP-binding protein [Chitinophagaceae bacterium]|nr:ABC transporter ATP-binding protein [Chitinophagaceae bacterium]